MELLVSGSLGKILRVVFWIHYRNFVREKKLRQKPRAAKKTLGWTESVKFGDDAT